MNLFSLDLDGTWQLTGRREIPHGTPQQALAAPEFATAATVPGNLELELYRAGRIADPYKELNAQALRPYEFYEWVFRREFSYDGKTRELELCFSGVDCLGCVFLNGQEIGRMENALIPHAFRITGLLRPGENTLCVHLASANRKARTYPFRCAETTAYDFNMEILHIRKSAHVWGWDIAPRMALGGLFGHVEIREVPVYAIRELHWNLLHFSPEKLLLRLLYHLALPDDEDCLEPLQLAITGECGDSRWRVDTAVRTDRGMLAAEIPEACLWWPRHYGAPNLYTVRARLMRGGTQLCEKTLHWGFRKLELRMAELAQDGPDPDFQFIVNDVPVRVFGFNHVPADALHSRSPERIGRILDMAVELDCNMLRLWGGGSYEPDAFFDRCDREGILVWHDFMMACTNYPQDASFQAALREEAESVVKRLRHHPSIALWSGDNECDGNAWWAHLDPKDNRLTREVLPEICAQHDPGRPYLCSSPWFSPEAGALARQRGTTPDLLTPEQHLWGPRDYFKSDFYRNTRASFVSEIGYHGAPAVQSIKRFTAPEAWWPGRGNEQWNYHASNPYWPDSTFLNYRIQLMFDQVKEMFGFEPECLEDFVLASQLCQAEAKKYFLELARGRWKISGMLWWNLIDCWPQFSDAVVDYYFVPKLAYHYLRRLQQPLLCLVDEAESWHRRILTVNDSSETHTGKLRVWDAEKDEVWYDGHFSVPPGTIAEVTRIRCCTTEQRLILLEWELSDGSKHGNHCVCGHPPFDFAHFRTHWLPRIAALPAPFAL